METWIKIIAELIAAGSLLIGVVTFWRRKIDETKKRDEAIIRNWQKVAIYKVIQDGNSREGHPIDYLEIKREYYQSAREFKDIDIPKNEIQDSALRLALLSLLEHKLIELMEDGKYRVTFLSSWEQKLKELELMDLAEKRLGEKVVMKLDRESGKYDKGELWGLLKNDGFSDESYFYVIQKMISTGIITIDTGGTLSLTKQKASN